jgi:hypothetical protein
VNLRWNPIGRFEAEFSSDFQGDLDAVKLAKFKTDGPPGWVWHTNKIDVINRLRKNKPQSGLSIYPQALQVYEQLKTQHDKNIEVKKQFKKAQLALKNSQEAAEGVQILQGKMFITKDDLPPMPPRVSDYVSPPPPDLKCLDCQDPVYWWEYPEIPRCLWCQIQLEKVENSA